MFRQVIKITAGISVSWCLLTMLGCTPVLTYLESGITNLRQITFDPSTELSPAYSKDGEKIAFASNRSGYLELWAMSVSGGGIQQITNCSGNSADYAPDWSADGDEIVFESTRVTNVWNIWKISLGNRGLTQLTNNQFGAHKPKWSSNGENIVFEADDKTGATYVWTMDKDGNDKTVLGPGISPNWSPDGTRIVFSRETIKNNYDIWVMNADGTNPIQLTSQREKQELTPVWAADGKYIAYTVQYTVRNYFRMTKGKVSPIQTRSEIWMMDINAKNPTQLTAFSGVNITPSWSPKGDICFVSNRGESWDLWSMVPLMK